MNKQVISPTTAGGAPDERFGVWGEPAVVITYAPSGVGKTTDMLYSLPTALHMAQKGALKPVVGTVGLAKVWEVEIRTMDNAIAIAVEIGKLPWDRRPSAIVIDDLSLLADNSLTAMEESGRYKTNKFKLWSDLKQKVQQLANIARWEAGVHVLMNSHDQAPHTDDDGRYWRGGPRLPSKKLSAVIPHVADTVLRGRLGQRSGVPHQAVYDCYLDNAWIMKDRHGTVGENLPMNIGELLRGRGYYLPRSPGLEWQEGWAELIAKSLDAGKDLSAVKHTAIERMQAKNYNPLHIRWALRDGIDRHAFRVAKANVLAF